MPFSYILIYGVYIQYMEKIQDFIYNHGGSLSYLFEGMNHELIIDFGSNNLQIKPTDTIHYLINNGINTGNQQSREPIISVGWNGESFSNLLFELNETNRTITIFTPDMKEYLHFQYVSYFRTMNIQNIS